MKCEKTNGSERPLETYNNLSSRHAYMILAHHQFDLLALLCSLLDHPQHDLFIHVDKHAKDFDETLILNAVRHSHVYFIPRTHITWGGTHMIHTELRLLHAALEHGPYSYYHLLSGVDLPLRPADEIHSFFEAHAGSEFIHFSEEDYNQKKAGHINRYYWFGNLYSRDKGIFFHVERISLVLQAKLKIKRSRKNPPPFKCGSQWFSITEDLARYTVQNEKWIKKFFAYTRIPDENMMQMLIANTEFYDRRYFPNEDSDYHSCMRLIDWKRGQPYTFLSTDYDELTTSDFLFARKFDWNRDRDICLRLAEHVRGMALSE